MEKFRFIIVSVFLLSGINSNSQDFRPIKNLSGSWFFSVGDNPKWADPNFDDSDWDQIKVPAYWENQGYDDYDGYAWYRKTFKTEGLDLHSPAYLLLGRIDDVSEVYLNGKSLARTGSFPPNYNSKYNEQRDFRIPDEVLKNNSKITIAVKVYDLHDGGGISDGKIGIYYDYDSNLIDIPLSGKWKFKTGKNSEWFKQKFPDENWDEINVPGNWENQGYDDYDGYACYRKTFEISGKPGLKDLYLVLGKIDDLEYVYLNGELLGSYKSIRRDFEYIRDRDIWRNFRYYPIPENLLKQGKNQISVQVLDERGSGGIYSGPVGFTSRDNYRSLKRKYHRDQDFWEFLIESIFD